tara:strand:- start:132 stop:551 length:420 start_codon:yes stop_codon:yes gene_type:complete
MADIFKAWDDKDGEVYEDIHGNRYEEIPELVVGCRIAMDEPIFTGSRYDTYFEGWKTTKGDIIKIGEYFFKKVSNTLSEQVRFFTIQDEITGKKVRRLERTVTRCVYKVVFPDGTISDHEKDLMESHCNKNLEHQALIG